MKEYLENKKKILIIDTTGSTRMYFESQENKDMSNITIYEFNIFNEEDINNIEKILSFSYDTCFVRNFNDLVDLSCKDLFLLNSNDQHESKRRLNNLLDIFEKHSMDRDIYLFQNMKSLPYPYSGARYTLYKKIDILQVFL